VIEKDFWGIDTAKDFQPARGLEQEQGSMASRVLLNMYEFEQHLQQYSVRD
jgi:hypothetical protein